MLGNQLLMSAVTGWVVAQFLKTLIDFALNKNFNAERLVGSGGMPSSHSSLVMALTTSVGKYNGFDSALFAISLIFSFVVMYDAAGIRRAAGKQAEIINYMIEHHKLPELQKVKELLEVFVGAILGIVVGLLF